MRNSKKWVRKIIESANDIYRIDDTYSVYSFVVAWWRHNYRSSALWGVRSPPEEEHHLSLTGICLSVET